MRWLLCLIVALKSVLKPMAAALAQAGKQNDIPARVEAVIMACLAKSPEQRPNPTALRETLLGVRARASSGEASDARTRSGRHRNASLRTPLPGSPQRRE